VDWDKIGGGGLSVEERCSTRHLLLLWKAKFKEG
jgi:hypothetical protein